jgi:hypothetical protein
MMLLDVTETWMKREVYEQEERKKPRKKLFTPPITQISANLSSSLGGRDAGR